MLKPIHSYSDKVNQTRKALFAVTVLAYHIKPESKYKVSIYMARSHKKISNSLSTSRQYFAKVSFQLTPEDVESRRLSGSKFQVDGPATAKHRRP